VKLLSDIDWKVVVNVVTIAHTRAVSSLDIRMSPNQNKVNEL